jgi:hypothetical protein
MPLRDDDDYKAERERKAFNQAVAAGIVAGLLTVFVLFATWVRGSSDGPNSFSQLASLGIGWVVGYAVFRWVRDLLGG